MSQDRSPTRDTEPESTPDWLIAKALL